ncbi:MAG: hypothetical protein JWN01_1224 [Patescibacteria group bacterium]|nr:hypothetical protein [Patescibacteria group bacterium]
MTDRPSSPTSGQYPAATQLEEAIQPILPQIETIAKDPAFATAVRAAQEVLTSKLGVKTGDLPRIPEREWGQVQHLPPTTREGLVTLLAVAHDPAHTVSAQRRDMFDNTIRQQVLPLMEPFGHGSGHPTGR